MRGGGHGGVCSQEGPAGSYVFSQAVTETVKPKVLSLWLFTEQVSQVSN